MSDSAAKSRGYENRKAPEQFRDKVFPDEAKYVAARWRRVYGGDASGGKSGHSGKGGTDTAAPGGRGFDSRHGGEKPRPSVDHGLVGIAFSGGGIRSATINLGVSQALEKRGILRHADYMSTVSGGGYLGSSLSTIMRDGAEFPFKIEERERESPYLTWLRNHSNYLAERGLVDYLRIIAILLRGIVLNMLVLVPLLLTLSLVLFFHYGGEWDFGNAGVLREWNREHIAATEAARAEIQPIAAACAENDPCLDPAGAQAMMEEGLGKRVDAITGVSWKDAYYLTPRVAVVVALFFVAFPVVIRVFKVLQHDATAGKEESESESSVGMRNSYELSFAWGLLLLVGVAALETMPVLLHAFHHLRTEGIARGTVAGVAGGGSVLALTLVGRFMQALESSFTRKLVLIGVGLLGFVVPLLLVLYVAEGLVYDWDKSLDGQSGGWWVLAGLIGLLAGGLAASGISKLTGKLPEEWANFRLAAVGLVGSAVLAAPLVVTWNARQGDTDLGFHTLRILFPLLAGWGVGTVADWLMRNLRSLTTGLRKRESGALKRLGDFFRDLDSGKAKKIRWTVLIVAFAIGALIAVSFNPTRGHIEPAWFVLMLALTINLFTWASLDINLTSVHGLYRDRLAEAYLVGVDADTRTGTPLEEIELDKIDVEGDLNLQDICQDDSVAPYHLVNAAHNLQGSKDPGVRERSSDFFVFSKYWAGGNRTGYCSTEHMERVFPQMDLATAMAISAAAAAPNMGKGTSRGLVAIMTLLNVRLGYWVPNPAHLNDFAIGHGGKIESTLSNRFAWRVPPRAFFSEMLSKLNETDRWVNLSDGGHLENLAVYELLRRRCKFIIAGDGEGDVNLQFNSLATLKRYASIDMGIQIEILLDDLRLGDDGRSSQHCSLGLISYPKRDDESERETGYLLYVKSSVTGDEDEVITQYRAKNPAFPHESTADQFFTEGQFEAYRALGEHLVDALFDREWYEYEQLEQWFTDLEANLAPRSAANNLYLDLQSELGRIRAYLRKPEYERYFLELYRDPAFKAPEPGTEEAAEYDRATLFLAGEQLRLMENVFLALNLESTRNRRHDGNSGWMNMFRQWADTGSFRKAYEKLGPMHSQRFREFCRAEFGLNAATPAAPGSRPA